MATQQDCAAIEQAIVQQRQRFEDLEDEIRGQQNLLNSLFSNDPQRPDVQAKIDSLSRQKEDLLTDIHKDEQALKDCQQRNQRSE
jgi:Skp family chaperone for outer membrane proteins